MKKAICPSCGQTRFVEMEEDGIKTIRVVAGGMSLSFVPKSNLALLCKKNCGFIGEWNVEQQEWETSISRG